MVQSCNEVVTGIHVMKGGGRKILGGRRERKHIRGTGEGRREVYKVRKSNKNIGDEELRIVTGVSQNSGTPKAPRMQLA